MRRIKKSLLKSVGLLLALFVFSLFDSGRIETNCSLCPIGRDKPLYLFSCCGGGLLTLLSVQKLEAKEGDSKIGKFRQHFEKEEKEEEGKKKEKKEEKNVVKKFFKYFKEKEPKKEAYTPPVSRYYPNYYYNYYYPYTYPLPADEPSLELAPRDKSFEQALSDIELAWQTLDIDLLMLYVDKNKPILCELLDEESKTLSSGQYRTQTLKSFQEIRTLSFKFEIKRQLGKDKGFAQAVHIYKDLRNKRRKVRVAYYLEREDELWFINNVRFSPGGAILRDRKKVPLALTYADIEQNKVALSYHYGRDKEDELRLYNYALCFGLWNYGGLGVSHFKIKEGEGEDYSSLSTTDIFFKGQFTKSQYKRASLGITLGLKTLNFSALDDGGEREHLNTLGLGIGGTLSFPLLRYFIGHGMISASSIEGLSLIDYEYGASLQLAPNVNLDLSYRALQIPAETLGGVRFGMEYKF